MKKMKKVYRIVVALVMILVFDSITNNASAYFVIFPGSASFRQTGNYFRLSCPPSNCICAGINQTASGYVMDIYSPCGPLNWTIPLLYYNVDNDPDGTT